MKTDSIIEDSTPLQTQHIPSEFVDREEEKTRLEDLFNPEASGNLFLTGSKGSGKTHLLLHQLNSLPDTVNSCYIPCRRCNTQYKALKQLYQTVSREEITTGHHTSTLQRKIEERTTEISTVIILDDIEFLLLNDGDSLLYKLSRTNPSNVNLIITSTYHDNLSQQLEERTWSSLQPQKLSLEPYTPEEVFQILAARSRDSLKPRSLHQHALKHIASTTSNSGYALTWLKHTAEKAESKITEDTVQKAEQPAYQNYIDRQLQSFTRHHNLLIQAIQELQKEEGAPVNTGAIYQRYQELCQSYTEDTVSNRRLSTYLKHLELLHLIESEYHYGGSKGKTREVLLKQ